MPLHVSLQTLIAKLHSLFHLLFHFLRRLPNPLCTPDNRACNQRVNHSSFKLLSLAMPHSLAFNLFSPVLLAVHDGHEPTRAR